MPRDSVSAMPRTRPRHAWLALLSVNIVWGLLMTQARSTAIVGLHRLLGPLSLVIATVGFVWLRPSMRSERGWSMLMMVGAGLVTGIAMVLATYPVFALAVGYLPRLSTEVAALYHLTRTDPALLGWLWTGVIVLAEELLWRGMLFEQLRHHVGVTAAAGLSIVIYGLVQLGTGSWIVVALALACGVPWTLLRVVTGSIVPSVIAHLVWTTIVLLVRPVI